MLGTVLGWLSRAHLPQPLTPAQETSVNQTSSKILPSLATLLPSLSSHHTLPVPALEFLVWCLSHLSHDKKLKSSLSSTLRRIGDCLYKPMVCLATYRVASGKKWNRLQKIVGNATDFFVNSVNGYPNQQKFGNDPKIIVWCNATHYLILCTGGRRKG